MSIADLKREQRAALHNAMAEPCFYRDPDLGLIPTAEQSAVGLTLSVRFKSKLKVASAESDGVSILEGVESLIFHQPQLDALNIDLAYGGVLEVPGYGISFQLDQELDSDGPLNLYWTVVRYTSSADFAAGDPRKTWSAEEW